MLVFGRVHVAAQKIGCIPQLGFETQAGVACVIARSGCHSASTPTVKELKLMQAFVHTLRIFQGLWQVLVVLEGIFEDFESATYEGEKVFVILHPSDLLSSPE